MLHNTYRNPGGEDVVCENEKRSPNENDDIASCGFVDQNFAGDSTLACEPEERLSREGFHERDNCEDKTRPADEHDRTHRLPLYSILADQFDLLVLHGGTEANRDAWGNPEGALQKARVVRAWGWQIQHKKKVNGAVFDEKFIHITPGFLWHLLRFRPDAIISSEMGFRSTIALAYGTIFRKPVWIWWGGTLHSERGIDSFRKALRKVFSFWVDRWITYGQTSTEYLLGLGVKRDRILQSQNIGDEERFKANVEPAWVIYPRPVVLYVGRLVELKGVKSLLDAAAILQQNGCEFSLLLVGNGREKQALEDRAKTLSLRNVHFRPPQLPERMPSVYRSADVVVFPTLEDVWGLVASEAILSGIPVLCSKYAGCAPELLTPENIFSPEDLDEFSEKLGAAVSGRLSKADPGRLRTTQQLGCELVQELNRFLPSGFAHKRNEPESVVR
jgi:glycosyltransferase involved in cell wall biosynthesis